MGELPDQQRDTEFRPEFDRTIIRAGSNSAAPDVSETARGIQADHPDQFQIEHRSRPPSTVWKFIGFAALFLFLGAGGAGLVLLVNSGAISFSAPDLAQNQAEDPASIVATAPSESIPPDPSLHQPVAGEGAETAGLANDDLETPADPFFDMAMSAVIPLAGDPVLLKSSDANRRIELSERPLGFPGNGENFGLVNAVSAYLFDSQMLDDTGSLITRAPGTEADFRFGNFGGGPDSEALDVVEEDESSTSKDLPVFLKPSTNTLDLYLRERPIGQGAHRIEIRERVDDTFPIKSFLTKRGFDKELARQVEEFMESEFGRSDFVAGDKISVRGVRLPNKVDRIGDYYRPVQLSLHGIDGFVGTAAFSTRRGDDGYVAGADPWFGKPFDTPNASEPEEKAESKGHRLIDGLYATAIRNAVPASIVGEAIAYLAPTTDLRRAIKPDERFTLLFTDQPRDEKRGGGRVLFAGVRQGDNWSVRCYVLKAPGNRGFACVNEGGAVSLSGAMLVPVKGVLTSKFGMRFHPIKKTERLHAGVDWAAPTGTPIRAAFSGKVGYRDVRGGYGNFIELVHKDGITSRYAHMHEYGEGIELGSVVQAGDLIGYVGTTGLSTGPHLHFEIRQRGTPTDPLAFEMETGASVSQSVSSPALKEYRDFVQTILSGQ
ncbi:M23 family metallopeptidase [Roseibium sp.]|uniref:M23 family metallopeptidase n=1 Tax=Roseibium sp. TaxID=1936156 RepID=UPI003BA9614E